MNDALKTLYNKLRVCDTAPSGNCMFEAIYNALKLKGISNLPRDFNGLRQVAFDEAQKHKQHLTSSEITSLPTILREGVWGDGWVISVLAAKYRVNVIVFQNTPKGPLEIPALLYIVPSSVTTIVLFYTGFTNQQGVYVRNHYDYMAETCAVSDVAPKESEVVAGSTVTSAVPDAETYYQNFKSLKYQPIPATLPADITVYLIGDIEGDYAMIYNWFVDKQLIDKDTLRWLEPNVVVFQLGDQLDKFRGNSPRTRRSRADSQVEISDWWVVEFFDILNQTSGGRVQSVLGNHEIMNVQENFKYSGYMRNNHSKEMFTSPTSPIFQMLARRPYVILFRNLLISHAGIESEHIKIAKKQHKIKSLQELVTFINQVPLASFVGTKIRLLVDQKDPKYLIVNGSNENASIVWSRKYEQESDTITPQFDKQMQELLGRPVNDITLVIGHNAFANVQLCTKQQCRAYDTHRPEEQLTIIKVDTGDSSRRCKDGKTNIFSAVLSMHDNRIVNLTQDDYVWLCDAEQVESKKMKF